MGKIPEGQKGTGTPSGRSVNAKNASKPDSIGSKGDGTGLLAAGRAAGFSGYGPGKSGPDKDPGSPSGIPNPDVINESVAPSKVAARKLWNPGANRQRFGIDPGRALSDTKRGQGERQTPRGGGD